MKKGLVSIVTPCYNGAKYIAETIESVLAQTYANWEMLIVDDGSKDESASIVREYAQKDARVQLIQQQNTGIAEARNHGIREAEGQYLAMLDADDLWDPIFLESQITFMKEKNALLVASSRRYIDENSKEIRHPRKIKAVITNKDMQRTDYIPLLTSLLNLEKHGKIYFHEELKCDREDYAFWVDVVKLEGVAYGNPQILASYRMRKDSTTGNKIKLIPIQYSFYRNYLKQSILMSLFHTCWWGLGGIMKYSF